MVGKCLECGREECSRDGGEERAPLPVNALTTAPTYLETKTEENTQMFSMWDEWENALTRIFL